MPYVFQETQRSEPRSATAFPSLNSEVLTETFAQTFEENPIASIGRARDLSQDYRTGPTISAETARSQLADRGMDGELKVSDAGITQAALDTLMFRKGIELKRREVFQQASGTLGQKAAQLGVGLATSLVDPLNVATAFIPVIGEARYAKMLGGAGGVLGRTAIRAGVGAAEGLAGAALVEPIIYGSRNYEQADYTMADSMLNVAFGGLFGAGLHVVGGAVSDGARAYRGEDSADFYRAQARQMSGEKPPRIEPTVDGVPERAATAASDTAIATREPAIPVEETVIRSEVTRLLDEREQSLRAVIDSRDSALASVHSDSTAVVADLQRAVDGRNRVAAEISQLPADSPKLKELIEQQSKYQDLVDSRQGAVDRLNHLRVAEADLEQLQYLRNSAESIDDLVDALPTEQQRGLRQRIEQGRLTGDVSPRPVPLTAARRAALASPVARETALKQSVVDAVAGDPVNVDGIIQPGQTSRAVPQQDLATAVSQAEEVIARETDSGTPTADALTMAKEEESLATSDLQSLADRLGVEAEDADMKAVNEAAKLSERWAKAAELATVCLMRGG